MKQKLIACGLSAMLLLAQNAFVFSQNAVVRQSSNDDVIGLFDDPDVVAVVQIKKILSETAPVLLGAHPETVEKIKSAMNDVENEIGVDPYALDKIYFGMNLGDADKSLLIVLKTSGSASDTVERIVQAQIAKSKFATEINPLKNRVDKFERRLKTLKENIVPASQPNEAGTEAIETFEIDLGKMKVAEAEQVEYAKLKADTAELKKVFAEYRALLKNVYDAGDLNERFEAVKKQIETIGGGDPQRAAKIAAADKALAPLEKELADRRNRMAATDEAKIFAGFTMNGFPRAGEPIPGQTKTELSELQSAVSGRIENLKKLNETMSKKEIEPGANLKKMDEADKFVTYPISETSTRREENIAGKKLSVVTTEKKFPEKSENSSPPVINNFLVFDEQTIIIGERNSLTKAVEPKTADANKLAKNMLARVPDALVSFGVNFRNMDMSELTKTLGEQKNAWQIVGSLDSGGNDISLSAAFERSDSPINVQPKKPGEGLIPQTPDIPGKDEIKDLVGSMFKSMIGIEAKVTIRFDKQKTASFAENAPKFLSGILKR